MFTGIIEARGTLKSKRLVEGDLSLSIDVGQLDMNDVQLGDSIAVNGVCLTVTSFDHQSFQADVSQESLRYTCFKETRAGQALNLEKALTLSTRLGGHLISGHVDGMGSILEVGQEGRSLRYEVACPKELGRYVAAKGSISIDGASLTVTALSQQGFYLNIVPHTAAHTIMPDYQVGTIVHLEVDMMARYAERLLLSDKETQQTTVLSRGFLAQHGFG